MYVRSYPDSNTACTVHSFESLAVERAFLFGGSVLPVQYYKIDRSLIYQGKDYYTAPEKAAILATQFQSPHLMPAAPPFARHDQRVKKVTQPPAAIVAKLRGNGTHHPHGSYQQYSGA